VLLPLPLGKQGGENQTANGSDGTRSSAIAQRPAEIRLRLKSEIFWPPERACQVAVFSGRLPSMEQGSAHRSNQHLTSDA